MPIVMRTAVAALVAAALGCLSHGGSAKPPDAGEPRADSGPADGGGSGDSGDSGRSDDAWRLGLADDPSVTVAAIAVSGSGLPYVAGWFAGSVTIAGEPLESAGGEDGFLLALDADGGVRWLTAIGGGGDDRLTALTAADGARVYVTGSVVGSIDLGGGSIGERDEPQILAASIDSDGTHRWSRVLGEGAGTGIATNATGNIDVTGTVAGEADFGGGAIGAAGRLDGFVASFDADGGHRWSMAIGGDGALAIDAIGNDLSCNVYVTGAATGAIDLPGACATAGAMVASWDQFGAFRWSRCLPDGARTTSVAVTGTGRVALAGTLSGAAELGETVTSAGARDALVVGLDRNGGDRFAAAFGGAGEDEARAVALDPIGRPYVAGVRAGEGAFVVLWDAPDAPVRIGAMGLGTEAIGLAIDPGGDVVVAARDGSEITLHRY